MIRRQPVLRTVIGMHEGEPFQQILDATDTSLPFDDLSGIAPAARESELVLRLEDEIAVPFDLGPRPAVPRAGCMPSTGDHHVLLHDPTMWSGTAGRSTCSTRKWPRCTTRSCRGQAPSTWHRFAGQLRRLLGLASRLDERTGTRTPVGVLAAKAWEGAPDVACDPPADLPRPTTRAAMVAPHGCACRRKPPPRLRALGAARRPTLFTVLLTAWATAAAQAERPARPRRRHAGARPQPARTRAGDGFLRQRTAAAVATRSGSGVSALLLHAVRNEMVDALGLPGHPVRAPRTRARHPGATLSRFPIYQAFFSYQDVAPATRRLGQPGCITTCPCSSPPRRRTWRCGS